MNSLKQIENFLSCPFIAVAGVSRNPKKFGHVVFRELREKGMNVFPVNPSGEDILNQKTYRDLASVPEEVSGLLILTGRDKTAGVIREAKAKGIKNIWIQQMSESKEALREFENTDINYITGQCILMFYKPHGFHKFHLFLKKLFGRYPG